MTVDLSDYGASEDLLSDVDVLGRIIRVDRGECDVISKKGTVRAVSDSSRSQREVAPVTGDWVKLLKTPEFGNIIDEILPRKNKLSRRDPSDERVEQVLVSNLDLVVIVHGIDRPLPPGRIERLLTLAWSSQSEVIIVLTKVKEKNGLLEETIKTIEAIAPKIVTFAVNSADAYMEQFNTMKNAIAGMGFLVTGISLVVSAIGIMNVMFVSVRERTREIGLRKAMGATNFNILTQFLSEAVAIAIIGGSVGIALIRLTVFGLASFPIPNFNGATLPISFDLLLVFYTFTVCVFIGVLAGLIPARTAANLNPIDALRDE